MIVCASMRNVKFSFIRVEYSLLSCIVYIYYPRDMVDHASLALWNMYCMAGYLRVYV